MVSVEERKISPQNSSENAQIKIHSGLRENSLKRLFIPAPKLHTAQNTQAKQHCLFGRRKLRIVSFVCFEYISDGRFVNTDEEMR